MKLLMSRVKPGDTEFEVQRITFSDFMKFMNIPRGGKQYSKIYESISILMGISFAIEVTPGVTEFFHWIADGCKIDENNKMIYIQLSPGLKKFLTGKKKNFTSYELGYVMNLKKKYSGRLYEYLRSMMNLGCVNLKTETFAKRITDGVYKRPADQLRYVINPALKEINETTDITVSCEEVRENSANGRMKIIGYKFHIKEKSYEEKQIVMGTWGVPFEDILLLEEGQRPDFSDIEEERAKERKKEKKARERLPFSDDDDE